ncbi:hypothetical protein [Emticicia sp. C21]|uniref:hypothetical protein n=1 Tax=Emticicia sp. C21 TaxID=2302915 RepID=UPI000E353B10|nr:hypothetical protein [Emticicia sp. C21]RFS16086.1 hypothetical protein D0T08_14450 [Emticicia sp. C21]
MAKTLYSTEKRGYKTAFIKEIREIYFEGMSQATFVALFTDEHLKELKVLRFTGFRGYQNSAVVRYMVEVVGRISPPQK